MRAASLAAITALMAGLGCDDGQEVGQVGSETTELHGQPNKVVQVVNQVNLVSDQPGVARTTDPGLVNAWGLAFAPAGRAWVASNEKGHVQIYDSASNLVLSVAIPPPHGGTESHPTGQVFNASNAFRGDRFIIVTEDGTITGWQPTTPGSAILRVDNSRSGAIYKGVALGSVNGQPRLYAADFHNNKIDVYDEHYRLLHHDDRFVDPGLPSNYAPFNVLARGPFVFVTYAQQDAAREDDVKGPGHGFLVVYSADGTQHRRLISRGALNSPWGMAFEPPSDDFSVRLWVGNFGDGRVNAYRVLVGDDFRLAARLEGALGDRPDHPLAIDGLWAIAFGPGQGGFSATDLYFTAGPDDESHGLFGTLVFPRAPQ
jgi:uncharacterized protein (TIGR03118 family)